MDSRPQLSVGFHSDTPVAIRGLVESCRTYGTDPAIGRHHYLEPNTAWHLRTTFAYKAQFVGVAKAPEMVTIWEAWASKNENPSHG
jgi:hypothetical protein